MEWAILGFLALAWLISPIILLIAVIVARRQVRELRRRPVARSVPESPGESLPVRTASVSGGGHYALAELENLLLLRLFYLLPYKGTTDFYSQFMERMEYWNEQIR